MTHLSFGIGWLSHLHLSSLLLPETIYSARSSEQRLDLEFTFVLSSNGCGIFVYDFESVLPVEVWFFMQRKYFLSWVWIIHIHYRKFETYRKTDDYKTPVGLRWLGFSYTAFSLVWDILYIPVTLSVIPHMHIFISIKIGILFWGFFV